MIQAIDTKNYITPIDTPDNILNKLEMAVLGPIRLAIFAPESEEIFVTHHIEMSEAMRLHENAQGIYSTQVEVFHKQKPYRYIIDRGSREHTGQLNKEQIEKVVEPILRIYIERLECMFFIHHADHSACIRNHEENKNTIEL